MNHATIPGGYKRQARMLSAPPLVATPVRMPNEAWLAFLNGNLNAEDWALIARVEAGEITVDEAMAGRVM